MSGFSSGGQSSFNISFGSNSCSNLTTTFLWPGNELEQASQIVEAYQPIRLPPGKTAKISKMRVRANNPATGQKSTFTLRKRSPGGPGAFVDTLLVADLNAGSAIASDDVNEVSLIDGDEFSVQCVPTVGQTAGPSTYVMAIFLVTLD